MYCLKDFFLYKNIREVNLNIFSISLENDVITFLIFFKPLYF